MSSNRQAIKMSSMLFVFLIISELRFFSIPYVSTFFSSICNYHMKLLSCFIILLFAVLMLKEMGNRNECYRIGKNILAKSMIYFIFVIFITYVASVIVYNNTSPFKILGQYHYYISYFLFFVLIYYMRINSSFANTCITILVKMVTIYAIYSIVSKWAFQSFGIRLMDATTQLYSSRNGSLRFGQISDYVALASILSFIQIYRSDITSLEVKKNFFRFSINLFAILYVSQTRMYVISIVATIIVILLMGEKKSYKKIVIVGFIFLSSILLREVIGEFISTFSEYSYSTQNRVGALVYYSKKMFDMFLIGIGFPSTSNSNIIRGVKNSYSLTDCGYIGFLAVFGVLGLIFLILLLVWLINNIFYFQKSNNKYYKKFSLGLGVYFIISNFTLGFADPQRVILWQIVLAILYYYRYLISYTERGR